MKIVTSRNTITICFFAICILLLFFRRTDAFFLPQFWAEDGPRWFAEAYHFGWGSLLLPQDGYFQTISRIGGLVDQLVPLLYAPFVFVLLAFVIELLPVGLILFNKQVLTDFPKQRVRIMLVLILILAPNISETYVNLTNSQWHLAFSALILIIGNGTSHRGYRLLKYLIIALSAFSGPFTVFFLPVIILKFRMQPTSENRTIAYILGISTFIQLLMPFLMHAARSHGLFLEISPVLLFKVIEKQIIWGGIVGPILFDHLLQFHIVFTWTIHILTVFFITTATYTVLKYSKELSLFLLFTIFVFIASYISHTSNIFDLTINTGLRYWLLPIFFWIITIVFVATKAKSYILRLVFSGCILAFILATPFNYFNTPYINYRAEYVNFTKQFELSSKGDILHTPINPLGFSLSLEKR